jgi:thymidylate kinase
VGTLQLIKNLFAELENKRVSHCHWKSNTAIQAALRGETDLDLLVDSERETVCLDILRRLGFQRALDPQDKRFPGISHYFGYDAETGKLVHVHLHFQLLVGDDLLKSYRLPVNQAFLALAKPCQGVYLPPVELEFIVFVLRMTLKRRLLSVLVRLCFLLGNPFSWMKILFGMTSPTLPPSAQREFADLAERSRPEKLAQILADHFPFIEMELFQQCRISLVDHAPRFSWLTAGNRLTRALSPCSRYSSAAAVGIAIGNAFKSRVRSLLRRIVVLNLSGKTPESGGRIIAFVGGDGAGKSTMVEDTLNWLGRFFFVTKLHMGKPARGPLWYCSQAILKTWERFGTRAGDRVLQAIRFWLVARYRYRTYRRAVWLRQRGAIVLLDRVPLPGSRYMDTPRIAGQAGADGWLLKRLARMEEDWHEKIRADELIVLRLDPRIAAQRRPDDDPVLLAKRSGEIWHRQWPAAYAHLVDASRPLGEVTAQVRSLVWDILGRSGRVFELIGPAGSGKSTLAGELRSRFYNMQTAVSCRDHLLPSLRVTLRRLPRLMSGWFRGVPVNYLKRAVYTETVLYLLNPKRRRRYFPGRNVVLEIGPLFYLVFLEKESRRFSKLWQQQLREQLADSIDLVVWLDASNDILGSRIKDRSKWHRIKHGTPGELEKFLAEYRASFASVTEPEKGDLLIKNIDTGHLNVVECAEIVTGLLQEMP